MKKIGLISDTHGYIDDKLFDFFSGVDEVWHAGDVGNIEIIDRLEQLGKVRGVYGNIDGQDVRVVLPEHQRFTLEGMNIWITHIGGYPGRYDSRVKNQIFANPPDIFVCGHSHILKVIYDKKLNLLHLNPGAYGKNGFHKKRTAMRFILDNKNVRDLQILELSRS